MPNQTNPIEAEAKSIVKAYNIAKPDHAPALSWYGMTALRDREETREGFVFDVDSYLDRAAWGAIRDRDREIEYIEARENGDGEPALSVVVAVAGDPIELDAVEPASAGIQSR